MYCRLIKGVTAQVVWPGLRVGSHMALSYIRQMNRVNSHSDFYHFMVDT